MKLGIIGDEVSQELPEVIAFAREFGLDGVEIRSVFGRAFKDLTPDDVSTIGSQLAEAGLKVAGCASPVFKCELDDETEIAGHMDIFKRSLEIARQWDCGMVRVFTFLRRSEQSTGEEIRRAAEKCAPLVDWARDAGVALGIENEFSTIVGTGPECVEFLKTLGNPEGVGIVWDPCNVLYLAGTNDPVHDDFPVVRDAVIHVHIKDAARDGAKPAESCVEVGRGGLDLPAQMKMLKAASFDGWVTLETHWRVKALDKETTHLPAGYGFSEGGAEASRICMKNLQEMIQNA